MKMKKLLFGLCASLISISATAQTNVIAHRGYWKTNGSAQNSVAALLKADEAGCYGSEFDVWLTADGRLVVNHDSSFKGVGIESSNYSDMHALTLPNGENMPLLETYFAAAKKCSVKLVLELKKHSSPERETEAVEKIVEMADSFGLAGRMEYISFSLHACKEFVRLAPKGTPMYYLNGELSPKELHSLGMAGLDYHLSVVRDRHPEWIGEAHALGLKVNCWTVNSKNDMLWLIEHGVDFVTTDEPDVLLNLLNKR